MYKFRDDLTRADVAFNATGDTLDELFKSCALAVMEVMVDLKSVSKVETRVIELSNDDNEKLLFEFLEEIVYLKDADYILFCDFDVKISNGKLRCVCYGEKIDYEKQKTKVDIKAITYHHFKLAKIMGKWEATVIVDI